MFKVTKVEFLWSESPLFQRRFKGMDPDPPPSWPTIADANGFLARMATEGPKLGYHKTKFRITWEDGETYEGRYDLHHIDKEQENPSGRIDLADHVRSWFLFCSGERRPAHLTPEQYEEALTIYAPEPSQRQNIKDFLATHEL